MAGITLTPSFLSSMTAGSNGIIGTALSYTVTVGGVTSNAGTVALTVSAGTWKPTCLGTALTFWTDASDTSTLYQDTAGTIPATNGTSIALWKDKSGNGYDASQSVLAQRPTLTAGGLVFGGNATSTNLVSTLTLSQLTSTNQATMFAAVKAGSGNTAYGGVLNFRVVGGNNTGLIMTSAGNQYGVDWWTNGIYGWTPGDSFTVGSMAVVGFVNNGATQNLTYNGTVYNNSTATTAIPAGYPIPMYIGQDSSGSRFYSGSMSEAVILGSALSVSNRQRLEGYLAWKWGAQGSLAAGHPYLSSAP